MGLINLLKKVPKIPFIAAAWLLLITSSVYWFTWIFPNNNYLIIFLILTLSLFIFQIIYNILHFVRNKPKFNLKKVIVWTLILIFIGVTPLQTLIDLGVAFSRPSTSNQSNIKVVSFDKYPVPSPQPIPEGLEDTLFQAFINDPIARKAGWANTKRYLFRVEKYYGDAAYGQVGVEINGKPAGGGEWRMNKYNNQWVLYFIGQQGPECKYLQKYAYLLHDWQAFCYVYEKNESLNVKHPNERYTGTQHNSPFE